MQVWFWQRIVTPHMAELVSELACLECDVTYIAEQTMSADRIAQGWVAPELAGVRLLLAATTTAVESLVSSAPDDSIHICQGVRGNGHVMHAQRALKKRGLRQWVVMETVYDSGWSGVIKRLVYRCLFTQWRKSRRGVLAIGSTTPQWVVARGVTENEVFPFAYFLKQIDQKRDPNEKPAEKYRFIFVGQLVDRKRLDLFLEALQKVVNGCFDLEVIGSGPLDAVLKGKAEKLLPGRVLWTGGLTSDCVSPRIANADCLVLPSSHDGWGAVVSEALMEGTPVICSDACGSAGIVHASGSGDVFKSGNIEDLINCLERALSYGLVKNHERDTLANWARCLGAKAGATYLLDILKYDDGIGPKPLPPWNAASRMTQSTNSLSNPVTAQDE